MLTWGLVDLGLLIETDSSRWRLIALDGDLCMSEQTAEEPVSEGTLCCYRYQL